MICYRCHKDKSIEEFHSSNIRRGIYVCKSCNTERCREWRLKNMESERVRCRRYKSENRELVNAKCREKRDPIKESSRAISWRAKCNGEIEAKPCEVCGNPNAQMHHDDYNKPLDVRWLCVSCHQYHHHQVALSEPEQEVKG